MQGTTIEITLWKAIADKFYDHIEEGQVRCYPPCVTSNVLHGKTERQILFTCWMTPTHVQHVGCIP